MIRQPNAKPNPSDVERFRRLAVDYCRLVDGHRRVPIRGFLRTIHQLLPALYAAGLRLPESTPGPDANYAEVTQKEQQPLFRSLRTRLGNRDHYSEVFDSYDWKDRDPVVGSLVDDLSDMYHDLVAGLRCWKAGDRENAVWLWRFGAESHWGEHATSAMRAMHWLRREYAFGQPGAMPNNAFQRSVPHVTPLAGKRKGRATRPRR